MVEMERLGLLMSELKLRNLFTQLRKLFYWKLLHKFDSCIVFIPIAVYYILKFCRDNVYLLSVKAIHGGGSVISRDKSRYFSGV